MNEAFLETEKLVHSISDELLKLKSAVQQYEENRKSFNDVRESVTKIGEASVSLAANSKEFLTKLEQMEIEKRLDKLKEDTSKLEQEHSQQLKSLGQLNENLNKHEEITLRIYQDQLRKLTVTQGLVGALLALEAATLAIMFLK